MRQIQKQTITTKLGKKPTDKVGLVETSLESLQGNGGTIISSGNFLESQTTHIRVYVCLLFIYIFT